MFFAPKPLINKEKKAEVPVAETASMPVSMPMPQATRL